MDVGEDKKTNTALGRLPAGPFSAWLRNARNSLRTGAGTDVECGECTACCTSSYFIHIRPEEAETLKRLGKTAIIPAPGLPSGHKLMGYDRHGICPQMNDGKCSVYAHRPQTCRNYDCRVFAGAGISAGEDKPKINARVDQWRFEYPTAQDREEHEAVRAAARFIRNNAAFFPGGRIPTDPSRLAILAIKVYEVFLKEKPLAETTGHSSAKDLADVVVAASKKFESPGKSESA